MDFARIAFMIKGDRDRREREREREERGVW
jgi:hypothetical protein